jgi:hypothetical protein
MILPPKYTDSELQYILETDPQLPENLNEQTFFRDIRYNMKIKWRVNNFLFDKQLLPFLVDTSILRKWKIFKLLNQLIVLSIIVFAIGVGDYKILLFLIFFPFLTVPFDHGVFIFIMSVLIGITLFFNLNILYFWFFVIAITIGYLLRKISSEIIERQILKQALSDWIIFWKYYSNKMIWMDISALNNEYEILTDKYPELRTL